MKKQIKKLSLGKKTISNLHLQKNLGSKELKEKVGGENPSHHVTHCKTSPCATCCCRLTFG